MDLKTGKTYATREDAIADGADESDVIDWIRLTDEKVKADMALNIAITRASTPSPSHHFRPRVIFSKGSFKNYIEDEASGVLVRGRLGR